MNIPGIPGIPGAGSLPGGLPVPGLGGLAKPDLPKTPSIDPIKLGEFAATFVILSIIMGISYAVTNKSGYELLSILIITAALFFGFAPYIYRCFIFYKYINMCLPRWAYAIASMMLWVFALFLYNKIPTD